MDDIRILKQAFDKAISNGWKDPHEGHLDIYWPKWDDDQKFHLAEKLISSPHNLIVDLIFSHDFAKAFWQGEPRIMYLVGSGDSATVDGAEAWKAHLQMLAITQPAERLKYLEPFL